MQLVQLCTWEKGLKYLTSTLNVQYCYYLARVRWASTYFACSTSQLCVPAETHTSHFKIPKLPDELSIHILEEEINFGTN